MSCPPAPRYGVPYRILVELMSFITGCGTMNSDEPTNGPSSGLEATMSAIGRPERSTATRPFSGPTMLTTYQCTTARWMSTWVSRRPGAMRPSRGRASPSYILVGPQVGRHEGLDQVGAAQQHDPHPPRWRPQRDHGRPDPHGQRRTRGTAALGADGGVRGLSMLTAFS